MYKFRFKTKEEFINEFGEGWRYKLGVGWNEEGMNPLFGTEFTVVNLPFIDRKCISVKAWNVTEQMVVPTSPEFAEKYYAAKKEAEAFTARFIVTRNLGKCSFEYKDVYRCNFTFVYSPTENCQLASIGNLESLLNHVTNPEAIERILRKARQLATYTDKKLYYIDIHTRYIDIVKSLLYTEPVKYISTNGSNMSYALLKID